MSKLKIRDSGAWVDPTNISVRQSGAWTPVDKVHIRENNAWQEVWPLSNTPIVADYVMFTISIANASDWPNLIYELQSVNPDWQTRIGWRGGKGHVDQTNPSDFGIVANNTRGTFGNEEHEGTDRVGRQEKKFGNNIRGAVVNSDDYMDRVYTGTPTTTQFLNDPKYNKIIVNFTDIRSDFVTGGLFDWSDSDLGIGDIIRQSLFLAWDYNFAGNPATTPITIDVDVYEGGSYSVDNTTNAVTFTGYTDSQSYQQTFYADKLTYDYYPTSPLLNFDYSALRFDWNFTTEIISLSTFNAPAQTTLPQFLSFDCFNSNSGTNLQLWIDSPRFDPSVYLDGPYYETVSGVLTSTIQYYQRTQSSVGTNYQNSGPGMDVVEETFTTSQFGGPFGYSGAKAYPYVYASNMPYDKLWWMIGYTDDFIYPTTLYSYFDIHQYQYDNPGITDVTIKVYGFQTNGSASSHTLTVGTYSGDKTFQDVNNATLQSTIGTVTKTLQTGSTANYGTPIAEVTIDYTNNSVTVTALP